MLPGQNDDQARELDELGRRATPGAEFFLSALLSGMVFGAGLLLDSPAMAVLAALLAPFMGPVIGLALASAAGSFGFLLRTLLSLLTGGLIFFLTGTLAGWVARLLPPANFSPANLHFLQFSLPDLVLLTVGIVLTSYLLAKTSQQRPLVSSVAIGYTLFLPLGAAGFALTSGSGQAWANGLLVFASYLVFAGLIGTLTFAVLGFRPRGAAGAILTTFYLLACLAALIPLMGINFSLPAVSAIAPSPTPSSTVPTATTTATIMQPATLTATSTTKAAVALPTNTPTISLTPMHLTATQTPPGPAPSRTPTHTLVPSSTPTETITTNPTPVWARINAKDGNGAYIRAEPDYNSNVVQVLLNGLLIQVLPDVTITDGATWVKVRTANGKEGWIIRSLLATATPAPGW